MSGEAKIIRKDVDGAECEFVESHDGQFGLGLKMPKQRVMAFPSIGDGLKHDTGNQQLLTDAEAKRIVESESYEGGEKRFDNSWLTNQNGYGSCAGYAAASALSKARVMMGQARVDLSGDYQYAQVNDGRDQGSGLQENMESLVRKGVATAATVPRGAIYPSKYNTSKADAEAARFKAFEPWAIPDEQSLVTSVILGYLPVIAIHVGRNWRKQNGDTLVGDNGPGNHCEHLDDVRYNRTKGRWEFREGSSHNRPYFWIHWGHLRTPARYHMFYCVRGATQDPDADFPTL